MGLELVIDESVVLDFMTYDAAGLPADADSLPTIEIYEDATDAAIAYAPTVVSRSLDGHYRVTIATTGANGFTAGNAYHVYVLATIATDDYKTKLDWAVARAFSIDSLKDAIDALIGTPVADVSTDIAAIKTQTDLIPADPATETTLAAIQAQTDLIPADPATETTLATIPGLVWEELSASHVTADTMGELLNGAGNPWSIAVTGNTDAGTFGEAVEATRAQAALIPADPATETTLAVIQGQTDLIPADTATEATLAVIQAQTDLIPADPATESTLATIEGTLAAADIVQAAIPDAVWDAVSASHITAGTTGKKLADASAAGNPWSAELVANDDPGTFGEAVAAAATQTSVDTANGNINAIGAIVTATADAITAIASAIADKTGYKLAADGLDAISTSLPGSTTWNFRQMVVMLSRRFGKRVRKASGKINWYADDGTTVLFEQDAVEEDNGAIQDQGAVEAP